jgi:multiple sugar transport system permease protein
MGIKGPLWLNAVEWSKPSLIMMSLWGSGGAMIIFLAGLQGIPQHLYEAAEIDGANRWRKFWNITVPLLTPTTFFVLVLGVIGSFQVFTQAYVMTGGGPADSTLFYMFYLYRRAFVFHNMGYASAMAWILFVIIFVLTVIQFATARRWVYYEGERR